MSTMTANQGIVIPVGGDAANNPSAFVSMIAGVEQRLVQRYTTDLDRATRNPAPATNELSIVGTNTWYDRYTGSKWLPCTPLQAARTSTQTVNNSTTLTNDTQLFINFPAVAATWAIEAWLLYTSSTVADFKLAFAADAAITGYGMSPFALATGAAGSTGDCTTQGTGTLGTAIAVGGAGATAGLLVGGRITTNGAAGVLQLQWAQNTLEVSNTQVFTGSWLRLAAIA